MPKYVAQCDNQDHPPFVHDCHTGLVLMVPPGWEWTGKANGSIRLKVDHERKS